ncbi:MAG: hypothetical protein WAM11_11715, partial [Cyanobium sp.]
RHHPRRRGRGRGRGKFDTIGFVCPSECGYVPILTTNIHNHGLGLAGGKYPHPQCSTKSCLGW